MTRSGKTGRKINRKSPRKPRLLWASPFCMMDTSSGASISVRQILMQLQRSGYEVQIVGATIFDHPRGTERISGDWAAIQSDPNKIVSVTDGSLVHQLVKTARPERDLMTVQETNLFYQLYIAGLNAFRPDVVFFYGGQSADLHISGEARARGIPSVAYLVNANYLATRWCRDVDLVITDTRATSDYYSSRIGLCPVPVGKFIDPADIIATRHERRHATLINPSWAKGAGIVATLALLLEQRRPDIIFEVVESRGNWAEVVRAVTQQTSGVARDSLCNVIVTPNTSRMADVYQRSRVVLGLSQWWESGSRVLAEAMLNGIPAIVSNTGGNSEMVGDGGVVVDLPPECHQPPYTTLPKAERLAPIAAVIERMWDDEMFHLMLMSRALQQGIALHRMEHSTSRLLAALDPLVKARAGENDPFVVLQSAHKHGLTEKPLPAATGATSISVDPAPVDLPQIVVVTEGASGAATFLFPTPEAFIDGEPTAVVAGGIDRAEQAGWRLQATAQRPILIFTSEVQDASALDALNTVAVHPLSELPAVLARIAPQLKAAQHAVLPSLADRLCAFAQGQWDVGDGRPEAPENGLSVGFVLFGNAHAASSRLHGQYVAEWLNQSSLHRATVLYRPRVRYEPDLPAKLLAPVAWAAVLAGCNTVVFQKTAGKTHLALMRILSELGMAIVFVDCDLRSNYAPLRQADHVIVTVDDLAARYRAEGFTALSVIPDSIDFRRTLLPRAAPAQVLRGVWIGTSDKFAYFDHLRSEVYAMMPEVTIDAISDHPDAEVRWQPELFPDVLAHYDFGFVTLSDESWSEGKSPNRAVLMMANGLPTLAQHRPTYARVIMHGETGFLFQTAQDVVRALEDLRNPECWTRIAAAGAKTARGAFGLETVGPLWISALSTAREARKWRQPSPEDVSQSQALLLGLAAAEGRA